MCLTRTAHAWERARHVHLILIESLIGAEVPSTAGGGVACGGGRRPGQAGALSAPPPARRQNAGFWHEHLLTRPPVRRTSLTEASDWVLMRVFLWGASFPGPKFDRGMRLNLMQHGIERSAGYLANEAGPMLIAF